jgi:ATP-binding cassette subfamily B protein
MSESLESYRQLLLTYLRPQWRSVTVLALLLFGSIALDLLGPQVLRRFIDMALAGGALDTLLATAAIYIGVMLAAQLVMVGATFAGERVGWRATNQLRGDLALHCLRQDMRFHNLSLGLVLLLAAATRSTRPELLLSRQRMWYREPCSRPTRY